MGSHFLRLWAKSDPPHPLWCHLIDVGAVAEALWDKVLGERTRFRLARSLGLTELEQARPWIIWLTALHDLGKAEPGFQGCHADLAKLMKGTDLDPRNALKEHPHGKFTNRYLRELLEPHHGKGIKHLCTAIGAHHGEVLDVPPGRRPGLQPSLSKQPYAFAREQLVALVEQALGIGALAAQGPRLHPDALLLHELAGFVSYADWIGSNTDFFPPSGESSGRFMGAEAPAEYVAAARAQASRAFRELGLRALPQNSAPSWRLFENEGSAGFAPNALQSEVAAILDQHPNCRFLLIEAPMGEGKTEAALYAASWWIATHRQPGAYLGLPTQATSNAMLGRVDRWLERLFGEAHPVESLLVHGALVHPEYYERKKRATYAWEQARGQECDEGDSAGVPPPTTAHPWFMGAKRALLASFGTGTIDQALLGAIFARHSFVRLAGLAGKTVIFDEVHAYDAYTSHLIERLLEYLSGLDCTVILLSATLPREKRIKFTQAFLGGGAAIQDTNENAYPIITFAGKGEWGVRSGFAVSPRATKLLRVESIAWELRPALEAFLHRLGERGCGAFLVNTVDEAQKAFRMLRDQGLGAGCERLLLFHSRFTAGDRARIEREVLELFGRDSTRRPGGRAVLVATQVVEQSLDLDFDLMATAIAPIDLLLQRSGRLHRHHRPDRPVAHAEPCLLVRMPDTPDYGNTGRIYDMAMLIRTHSLMLGMLAKGGLIRIPGDVPELIDAVYEAKADGVVPPNFTAALESAEQARLRTEEEHLAKAEQFVLPEPGRAKDYWQSSLRSVEEDNPDVERAVTRLGEDSTRAILLLGEDPPNADALKSGGALRRLIELTCPLPRLVMTTQLEQIQEWKEFRALRDLRVLRLNPHGEAALCGPPKVGLRYDRDVGLETVAACAQAMITRPS